MAGREVGPVFKKYEDPTETAPYIPLARALLARMKERMRRNGLKQLIWRRTLADGVFVHVQSVFGIDTIIIGGTVACSICPPLTENDETRTYWTEYRVLTSSDGLFTYEFLPIKTMQFTDFEGQTVIFNFDEPDTP